MAPKLDEAASIKRALRKHFRALGFRHSIDGRLIPPSDTKDTIRALHAAQRNERLVSCSRFLQRKLEDVIPYFANGDEVDPARITLRLRRVRSETPEADIFRIATLTWSVPVSVGFGRRMRYLVWDEYHDRLAGVIALGDPVFNLAARDRIIGWSGRDRVERLVNIMDAYVLGALPPYSFMLGGKAVACLIKSKEIVAEFSDTYKASVGVISEKKKRATLVAVTTSSSMGRSSVYNRLRLRGEQFFEPIGFTAGWGHFHVPDKLFEKMRQYLRDVGHIYADQHTFGEGLNWRLRTLRVAFEELGFPEEVLNHGIRRQVFLSQLAANAFDVLLKGARPDYSALRHVDEISALAVERWMIPRYVRRKNEVVAWKKSDIVQLLVPASCGSRASS